MIFRTFDYLKPPIIYIKKTTRRKMLGGFFLARKGWLLLKEKINNNELILECIEIYMGDYSIERQYAASILLKMILKEKKYKKLMALIREEIGFKLNDRNDASVISWKKRVKKVGKCQICGSEEKLVAHHIVPWHDSIKGRTDINNGMCLCKECHKKMHNDTEWINYMRNKYYGKE